ncbi:MAG TPA: NUDIX domain-containing protein [Roseiflexaceae bacterium]|nr:NUDIX domain-containing protein [Roseiflexaceae bacterium]
MDAAQDQPAALPALAAVVRPGVRVLLIDNDNRVLLFRSADEAGRPFWVPPGGGSEPGETAAQTARRELWEETGLRDVELVAEIGRRQGIASWGGVTYDCRERWFLARVPVFLIDTSRFTELEQASIFEHRWWTQDELAATPDRLVPASLARLVETLLRDGPPAQPLDLEF